MVLGTKKLGYGLVDAFQSLLHTNTLFLQNQIDVANEGYENIGSIRTGEDVDILNPFNSDYIVTSTADVLLKATERISLEVGTRIEAGANFRAFIDEFNGDCGDWLLPRTVTNDIPVANDDVFEVKANLSENVSQAIEVDVFPNPFKNDFNVNIQLTKEDKFSLNVYNSTGQIVYSKNGQLDAGKHQLNVPLHKGNGLYIIQLRIGTEIITKKIIKYE